MSLVWHIVSKDARRLALPVIGWISVNVVATIWLRCQSWGGGVDDLIDATNWIRSVAVFSNLASVLMVAGSAVLAGYLVLEDRVVGSDSFWQTRPISGRRLLTAKLIGAFLFLVIAPIAALLPVWTVGGFSLSEIIQATCRTATLLAGLVFGALTLAALTENLGVHVFSVLVATALGLTVFFGLPEPWMAAAGSSEVAYVRDAMTAMLAVPVFAFVLAHQFLTRRTRQGWTMLVVLLSAVVGVRMVWRWDLHDVWPSLGRAWPAETAMEQAVPAALPALKLGLRPNLFGHVFVDVSSRLADGSSLVPWSGRGDVRLRDGRSLVMQFEPASSWGEELALQASGLGRGGTTSRWPMTVRIEPPGAGRVELAGSEFAGRIRLMRMRPRVIAELHLRPDATWTDGVRLLRVIGWTQERRGSILIEEREAQPTGSDLRSRDGAWLDFFLMVNRKIGLAQPMRLREVGAATLNGVVTGLRVLEMTADPSVNGWRDEAAIIKVRFEREARFERTLIGETLAIAGGEEKP